MVPPIPAGSWARRHGLLLIDQPLGTGYSQPARNGSIPRDELGMAAHLYAALQAFYARHNDALASRPLFITGEVRALLVVCVCVCVCVCLAGWFGGGLYSALHACHAKVTNC